MRIVREMGETIDQQSLTSSETLESVKVELSLKGGELGLSKPPMKAEFTSKRLESSNKNRR